MQLEAAFPRTTLVDGGIPEIAVDGETGFLVWGNNPRAFAKRALRHWMGAGPSKALNGL